LVAFILLPAARDGALIGFRLKHVQNGAVFQDAREVRTERRKTFTTTFFPAGAEPLDMFADYLVTLSRN
jgi:hypothetical protein